MVDVVGRHVKLKKSGANWMGLCPFHNEKSPSFSVSPTKQFYYCFGCGANGSAIGFLIEHGGLSFPEAVQELAQSAGLQVPDEPARGGARAPDAAPQLTALLATAARFYKARLKESPRAIDYLKGRGVSGEVAARFGLGYAPDGWRNLEAAFADYDAPALVEAGLVVAPEADDTAAGARKKRYDRLRDRIVFPIRDARGRVVGFGGRVLDRGEPKYLNSPETPVFSKGRELYGLFEARDALRRTDCAIVVEGYLDVVMLSQHGVGNAVATLGTATTAQHVAKLMRLVDRVVFAFDADAAGRKAAWRALEASLPQAQDTKRIDFLFLPAGHDPDSFVREHGAEGFAQALQGAMPLSEFMVRTLSERVDLQTPEGRAHLQAEARPLLQALAAPALRQQMVQRVASVAGIDAAELARYLAADDGASTRLRAAGDGDARMPRDGRDLRDAHDPRGPDGLGGPRDAAGSRGTGGSRSTGDAGPDRSRPAWSARRAPFGQRRPGQDAPAPMPPPTTPDARRRVRTLSALYPHLAAQWWREFGQHAPAVGGEGAGAEGAASGRAGDTAASAGGVEWLPADLLDWLRRLAALPDGITYAALRETLLQTEPERVEMLDRELAGEGGMAAVAELSPQEARVDFEGAIAQVQIKAIKSALRALTGPSRTPQSPEALRERMAHLELQQRNIESRRDRIAAAANR